MRLIVPAFLVSALMSDSRAQALAGWSHRVPIRINTTATGAPLTGTVANYPLAVQIPKETLDFSKAAADGRDVRFTDETGKALAFEREHWSAADGLATFWVLVNEVKGNSDAQVIYAHWGNATAPDVSDGKAVFRADHNFVGVWHLSDTPGNAPDGYKESTANGEHGTGHNMAAPVNTARGVVGMAFHSDYPVGKNGANDGSYIVTDVATENTFDHMDNITFSMWVNPSGWVASAGYETPITKGDDSWRLQKAWNDRYMWEPCVQTSAGGYDCMVTQGGLEITPLNKWTLLHVVHHKPGYTFWANGKIVKTQNAGNNFYNNGKWPVSIGNQMQYAHTTWARRWWDGDLDEGRFIKESKNESWLKLDYESQKPGQTLVKFGAVEVSPTGFRIGARRKAMPMPREAWVGAVDAAGRRGNLGNTPGFRR